MYDKRDVRAEMLKDWGFECGCNSCRDPTSDVQRVQLTMLHLLLTSYESDDQDIPKLMELAPLQSRKEALAMVEQLAKLMERHGFVTMELCRVYRDCSQWYLNLDDLDGAIKYGKKALEVERWLIGPETEHLRENLIGCQYWLEKLEAVKANK